MVLMAVNVIVLYRKKPVPRHDLISEITTFPQRRLARKFYKRFANFCYCFSKKLMNGKF